MFARNGVLSLSDYALSSLNSSNSASLALTYLYTVADCCVARISLHLLTGS